MSEGKMRMDAYYYGFTTTGVDAIDRVLSAVACAGKAFHHTEDWNDSARRQDHRGATPVEWIQHAADDAAKTFATPPPEAAEGTAVSYDELTAAYRDQVAHTDLVRAEYQRRLTLAEARAQIAEGESAADLDTLGKVLARVRALEAALDGVLGNPLSTTHRDRAYALLAKATP